MEKRGPLLRTASCLFVKRKPDVLTALYAVKTLPITCSGGDYGEFRSQLQGFVNHTRGNEPGNPAALGRLLVEVVASECPPQHLSVGADAIDTLESHHRAQMDEVEAWRDKSCATAFPSEGTDTSATEFFK